MIELTFIKIAKIFKELNFRYNLLGYGIKLNKYYGFNYKKFKFQIIRGFIHFKYFNLS